MGRVRTRRDHARGRHRAYFIKQYRLWRGLTLQQVAQMTGTSHASIQRYENGLQRMYVDTIELLALAYRVSVDDLMHKPPPPKGQPVGDPPKPVQRQPHK